MLETCKTCGDLYNPEWKSACAAGMCKEATDEQTEPHMKHSGKQVIPGSDVTWPLIKFCDAGGVSYDPLTENECLGRPTPIVPNKRDNFKIITITGNDCVGKETQAKLLEQVLSPSKQMPSPNYNHWSGKIIHSILHQNVIELKMTDAVTSYCYKQSKHPQILQLLHYINTWDRQALIKEGLKEHHWVLDRYTEDALAYGLIDGCSLEFLLDMHRQFIPSDVVIVLTGKGFPRKGEVQDINEKDSVFQRRIRTTFESLSQLFTNWVVRNVDELVDGDLNCSASITRIHKEICTLVSDALGEVISPLSMDRVKEYVDQWENQRLSHLKRSSG